jgi:hypothetical protein
MTSYLKMATVQEKAMCVLRFLERKSVIKTRTQCGKDPPSDNAIRRWLKQFQETDSVLHRNGVGRPSTSQETVDRIQEEFDRSTQKSTRRALLQLGIPPTAAARVQSRVWSSGICGGQSGAGAGFIRVLRFPLPFIPPNSPSSQSPGAGTIGQ